MATRAVINSRYLLRAGLLAVFCGGFALWSLYDGTIGYPKQQVRALKFEELLASERLEEWDAICEENGWPNSNPGNPRKNYDYSIFQQFLMAGLTGPVGLLFLFFFLRSRRQWMESHETGIRTSWGQDFEFNQIVTLDKKKWKNKGIGVINYKDTDRKRRLKLDDCKWNTDATEAILDQIESNIQPEQIVGGPPQHLLEEVDYDQQSPEDIDQEVDSDAPQEAN